MSGRINPFALSRAFSSDSSDMDSVSSPRAKFVSTCMNCNYTFRRGSSISTEFCSKGKLNNNCTKPLIFTRPSPSLN